MARSQNTLRDEVSFAFSPLEAPDATHHLQPFASTRNPPQIGPNTGPSNGPIEKMAMAPPRFSTGMTSAIVPAPRLKQTAPKQPARKRNPISMPRLSETAQAIVKIRNPQLPAQYRGTRPYISLRGAMMTTG